MTSEHVERGLTDEWRSTGEIMREAWDARGRDRTAENTMRTITLNTLSQLVRYGLAERTDGEVMTCRGRRRTIFWRRAQSDAQSAQDTAEKGQKTAFSDESQAQIVKEGME